MLTSEMTDSIYGSLITHWSDIARGDISEADISYTEFKHHQSVSA